MFFTLYNVVLIVNLFYGGRVDTACLDAYTYHVIDGVNVELISTNEYCDGRTDVMLKMLDKDSDGKVDYVYINEDRD